MSTGNLNFTDLYGINHVVQNTLLTFPKELIIGILRDEFSKDSYFHYVKDPWGFPLTPDHTDLPSEAGLHDDTTTRVFIGEKYRYTVIYYPSILIATAGSSYVPISMNREKETIKYSVLRVIDGYGNEKLFTTPSHFVFAGAWEGSLTIDVLTRGIRERDELVEFTALCMTDIRFEEMLRAGLLIKRVSVGSPTESDDRNDKLYKQTITLDVRSEWRREIPVENLVDAINICVDFGRLDPPPPTLAPNLEINTTIQLVDEIQSL